MRIEITSPSKFVLRDMTAEEELKLRQLYTYKHSERVYDYKTKSWSYQDSSRIAYRSVINGREFYIGHVFSIMNNFIHSFPAEVVKEIQSKFTNTEINITNWLNLEDRDNAHQDLLELIKYKRGILLRPTGSGKTETIATLVKNILDNCEGNVMVISETSPSLNELYDRFRSRGIDIAKYDDLKSRMIIIKPSGFLRRNQAKLPEAEEFYRKVRFVIADEVETTPTNSFYSILLDKLVNAEYWYGFSATANKHGGIIPKNSTITEYLNEDSVSVANLFGFTISNKRPTTYEINVVTHKAEIAIPSILAEDHHKVIQASFRSNQFYEIVRNILNNYSNVFIPVNSRVAFAQFLTDHTSPVFNQNSILICGDGYQVWYQGEHVRNVSLDEMKELVSTNVIRVVLGTATSYRAINFIGLTSVLLTFDKQSALMKQIIGRLTRQDAFSVHLWNPVNYVPFLRNAYWTIYKEIKSYYSDCKLEYKYLNYPQFSKQRK